MLGCRVSARNCRTGATRCAVFDRGSSTAQISTAAPAPGTVMLLASGDSPCNAVSSLAVFAPPCACMPEMFEASILVFETQD